MQHTHRHHTLARLLGVAFSLSLISSLHALAQGLPKNFLDDDVTRRAAHSSDKSTPPSQDNDLVPQQDAQSVTALQRVTEALPTTGTEQATQLLAAQESLDENTSVQKATMEDVHAFVQVAQDIESALSPTPNSTATPPATTQPNSNPAPPPEATTPVPQPLSAEPTPPIAGNAAGVDAQKTTIDAEGGLYFDADKGIIVYLKNVKVRDPRFALDCAGQLRIYLSQSDKKKSSGKAKDSATPPSTEKITMPGAGEISFDEVKQIAASGHVVIRATDSKGSQFFAKAERVLYDARTGEIVLSGGYPMVDDGKNRITCRGQDDFIRVSPERNITVSGSTITSVSQIKEQTKGADSAKPSAKPQTTKPRSR